MNSQKNIARLKHLRLVGVMEGISYLVLLGIGMPLKYLAGKPEVVKVVGWAHGVLFVWYAIALLIACLSLKKSFGWLMKGGIASLLPFGPFVFDKGLKKDEQEIREALQEVNA